jgi:hypothetical protein
LIRVLASVVAIMLLELRINLVILSMAPSKGARMASSNIRQLIIMLDNTLATVLTDIVGVCVGNRGVLVSNALTVVGVLVFIDTSGGGRFGLGVSAIPG